jgi:hypothetical protein
MTTKDDLSWVKKEKHQDTKYSNINLNKSYKCPILIPAQIVSKTKSYKHPGKYMLQFRRNIRLWDILYMTK